MEELKTLIMLIRKDKEVVVIDLEFLKLNFEHPEMLRNFVYTGETPEHDLKIKINTVQNFNLKHKLGKSAWNKFIRKM